MMFDLPPVDCIPPPNDVDGDGNVGILGLLWVLGDWQGVEPFIEVIEQWGVCTNTF